MDELYANLTIDVSAGRYGAVAVATVLAGITDAVWFRISNLLTIPLMVSGVVYHAAAPGGDGLPFTLFGAGCGFGILFLLFAAGGVGAGDVKLLAGIGAWIGAHDVLVVFIVAGLLNGLCTLFIIAWTNTWKDTTLRLFDIFRNVLRKNVRQTENVEQVAQQDERTRRRRLVPMGTMIACSLLSLLARDFLASHEAIVEPRPAGVTSVSESG